MLPEPSSPPERRPHRKPRDGGRIGQASPDGVQDASPGQATPSVGDASSPGLGGTETTGGSSPGAPDGTGEAGEAANAVSLLQELIQRRSSFSAHTKILTWNFEQQLDNDNALQFRAVVSFLFNDVPHHFCGGWQTSKKKAQRDTAERVRHYLDQRFEPSQGGGDDVAPPSAAHAAIDPCSLPDDVLRELQSIEGSAGSARHSDGDDSFGDPLEWQIEERPHSDGVVDNFKATLTFFIQNVPHHFAGGWSADGAAARRDVAERVLWYFGRSPEGFHVAERPVIGRPPSQLVGAAAVGDAPSPDRGAGPGISATASTGGEARQPQQAVEDKTILMQVQNLLQKKFARDTKPGQQVWVWEYEPDSHDPQLFRARVEVPAWGEKFTGDWCRGKKLAQRNACIVVKRNLDRLPPTPPG